MSEKEFPNGFEDWHETHFEIVTAINEELAQHDEDPTRENAVVTRMLEQGTGGLYLLAAKLTDEFEKENAGATWGDGIDYQETLEAFLTEKFKLD